MAWDNLGQEVGPPGTSRRVVAVEKGSQRLLTPQHLGFLGGYLATCSNAMLGSHFVPGD